MDLFLFVLFAVLAVGCAVNLVLQRHPIASALSLVGVMGSLAVLYLLLGAEFMAATQVIVYAGAIMVLFVFVIMLLNAGSEQAKAGRSRLARLLGLPLLVLLAGVLSYHFQRLLPSTLMVSFGDMASDGKGWGGARQLGELLFARYLLPFEVTSVLILIAILGAIIMARKEID
jgi:NADH-quinone oxidoreductase subunit J